jgi:hypothetical protein
MASSVLAKAAPIFRELNWAGAILVGVGLALATMLVVATMLGVLSWAFRMIKPLPIEREMPHDSQSSSDLITESDLLRDQVGRALQAGEFARQQLAALAARCGTLEERDKAIVEDYQNTSGKLAQSEERAANLSRELQEIRQGCAKLDEKVDRNEKRLRESLAAVWSQKRMNTIACEIEQCAGDLYLRLNGGENYTPKEWDDWVNTFRRWERVLQQWIDCARWYAKDVKGRIMTVEDREYDEGDWTVRDTQFPNADAVRRFKRHRIIQQHWEMVRQDADRGVILVAFSGLSEQEQHGGQFHQ